MRDLFSVKKVASIVSLPKKSVKKVLKHLNLITASNAITRTGLESGYVTELRVEGLCDDIRFTEVYLRITAKGVLMLIKEVCHEV